MGYKVQFESGQMVEFDREPTQSDIEEAYSQLAKQKQPEATNVLKDKMESERQLSRNILGGAIRGAGSIGATLLTPFDWAARKAGIENEFIGRTDRRQAMDAALKDLIGADPESIGYGLGKAGAEIAGTAGVPVGAVGLLSKFAPKTVAAAPNLVRSIGSSGFAGGMPFAQRAAGGAIAGGLSSAAVEPDVVNMELGAGVGAIAPSIASTGSKLIGKAASLFDQKLRAQNVLKTAIGGSDDTARALAAAPENLSTGQVLAEQNNPLIQALQQRADERLNVLGQSTAREQAQETARRQLLQDVAGGSQTATAAREAEEAAISQLGKETEPTKQRILSKANQATDEMLGLENVSTQARQDAADQVQKVKDMVAAGERADARAQQFYPVEGQPRISGRYSYMDTLAQKADEVATAYANRSLNSGQMARLAEAELSDMQSAGLKPLNVDTLISKINTNLSNEEFAGLKEMRKAMGMVEKELRYWSDNGGVIGAQALDAIRKNVINSVSTKLAQGNPTQQQKLAGMLTEKLRPLLIKSMEDAGGKGYGKYLADYAQARQSINQAKLGARAQQLYLDSPDEFIKLVEGNAPDKVEQIFGPGSYNIAKEMSADALEKLGTVSKEVQRNVQMEAQAKRGQAALEQLIEQNTPKFRLPSWFNRTTTTGNKILDILERRIGNKTMDVLSNALQNAKSTQDLLRYVPIGERMRIINLLKNPETWEEIPADARRVVQGSLINAFSIRDNKNEQRY